MTVSKVLLKISGEYLSDKDNIFSKEAIDKVASVVQVLKEKYDQLYIVLGGGNIVRGRELKNFHFDNGAADCIGMLSTMQNALMLKLYLDNKNIKTHVMSPFPIPALHIHQYEPGKAREWWAKEGHHIIILSGGIGRRGFTTDTAAVSCAYELGVDLVVKITDVGALFEEDPKKNLDAKKITKISFNEVLDKKYEVMDLTAFAFAWEKGMTIKISKLETELLLPESVLEDGKGTVIK